MKEKIIQVGLELILSTEGYAIRSVDLNTDLENQLINVVEKHCQFLKATNYFIEVYLEEGKNA